MNATLWAYLIVGAPFAYLIFQINWFAGMLFVGVVGAWMYALWRGPSSLACPQCDKRYAVFYRHRRVNGLPDLR